MIEPWFPLNAAFVPGVAIGTAVFGSLFFVVRRRYADAEARRLGAADLA